MLKQHRELKLEIEIVLGKSHSHLNVEFDVLYCMGGETVEQVSQRGYGCPLRIAWR